MKTAIFSLNNKELLLVELQEGANGSPSTKKKGDFEPSLLTDSKSMHVDFTSNINNNRT